MTNDILAELRQGLQRDSTLRLQFTRQAFHMLPRLNKPRILDVGCGQGEPTLELARLSDGEIIGVDVDQTVLDHLATRVRAAGLAERVWIVNGSMRALSFRDESFDLVWAEGAIFVLGFEAGLKAWRRLIRPNGFLVVHEMTWLRPDPPREIADHWRKLYPGIRAAAEYIQQVPGCGYQLHGHFPLPEDAWLIDYYQPLQARLRALRAKYAGDRQAQGVLDEQQRELDLFRKHTRWYGSAFYVMQKKKPAV